MAEENQNKSWLLRQWEDTKGNFKYDLFSRLGWPEIRATGIVIGGWLIKTFSVMDVAEVVGWVLIAVGIGWGTWSFIIERRIAKNELRSRGEESSDHYIRTRDPASGPKLMACAILLAIVLFGLGHLIKRKATAVSAPDRTSSDPSKLLQVLPSATAGIEDQHKSMPGYVWNPKDSTTPNPRNQSTKNPPIGSKAETPALKPFNAKQSLIQASGPDAGSELTKLSETTISYTGSIGGLKIHSFITFAASGKLSGFYYYTKDPHLRYRLSGSHVKNAMILKEYTGDEISAEIVLHLNTNQSTGELWEGEMKNKTGVRPHFLMEMQKQNGAVVK